MYKEFLLLRSCRQIVNSSFFIIAAKQAEYNESPVYYCPSSELEFGMDVDITVVETPCSVPNILCLGSLLCILGVVGCEILLLSSYGRLFVIHIHRCNLWYCFPPMYILNGLITHEYHDRK